MLFLFISTIKTERKNGTQKMITFLFTGITIFSPILYVRFINLFHTIFFLSTKSKDLNGLNFPFLLILPPSSHLTSHISVPSAASLSPTQTNRWMESPPSLPSPIGFPRVSGCLCSRGAERSGNGSRAEGVVGRVTLIVFHL